MPDGVRFCNVTKLSTYIDKEAKCINVTKTMEIIYNGELEGCNGGLCSNYGINFVQCIRRIFVIEEMIIDALIPECPFVDRTLTSITMENKCKRFLLYWWFSTNMYLVCGRNNRYKLPACLIEAMRVTYPISIGILYVGHKKAAGKKN